MKEGYDRLINKKEVLNLINKDLTEKGVSKPNLDLEQFNFPDKNRINHFIRGLSKMHQNRLSTQRVRREQLESKKLIINPSRKDYKSNKNS